MHSSCTDHERKMISRILLHATDNTIYDEVNNLKKFGLRFYDVNESWEPKSTNSAGEKMRAKELSIVISFYTKTQITITKKYAEMFNCSFWKYNLMVEVSKIPSLLQVIQRDYFNNILIPENFNGPGKGTTGIFLETYKDEHSARTYLELIGGGEDTIMYYFEPVNINQWNMFEKVKNVGHVEPFLATTTMKIGDILLLHVGSQNRKYESGIYAIATIIRNPYILENSPQDYCNNKLTIDARIDKISYSEPFIKHEVCKEFTKQFRTAHKIKEEYYALVEEKLDVGFNLQNQVVGVNCDSDNDMLISNIETDANKLQLFGKERETFVKTRVNQSIFRERLLEKYDCCCCLCKVSNPHFLIASHIKPWACSENDEKLDVDNGFLFCPNHDALFDSGYISFDDDGNIMISENLKQVDTVYMNVNSNMKIPLSSKNKTYLEYHRNNIFKK